MTFKALTKRTFAMLLCVAMLISLCPFTFAAAESEGDPIVEPAGVTATEPATEEEPQEPAVCSDEPLPAESGEEPVLEEEPAAETVLPEETLEEAPSADEDATLLEGGEEDPDAIPAEVRKLEDAASEVSVNGKLPENASLTVKVTDAAPVEEEETGIVTQWRYFDISLGDDVQPEGTVQVTLPVPETFTGALSVWYFQDGVAVEQMKEVSNNGKEYVFETDHFSVYGLKSVGEAEAAPQDGEENPDDDGRPTFTIDRIPGANRNDAIVNGERRAVFCMQYDYLWPVANDPTYHNAPTNYKEAIASEMLLSSSQLATVRRLLYAGYPYDAVGAMEPLYSVWGQTMGDSFASDLTQGAIWTLMAKWGVPHNSRYDHAAEGGEDIPGFMESYNAVMDFAENGTIPSTPSRDFVPELTGNTAFTQKGGAWITGAVKITEPDGCKLLYHVTFPEGVIPVDADGEEIGADYEFVDGDWKATGHSIYGDTTFYLKAENESDFSGKTVTFNGTVKLPTDVKQYVTNDTGRGLKEGDNYVQIPYQTMLSVGIATYRFSGSAVLKAPAPKTGDLEVTKAVAGNAADADKAFRFTVTLADTTVNGTYGDMAFENGVATFHLKDGGKATATGLPADVTYTVAEDDYANDGYQTEATGNSGTITADGKAVAAFVNTRDAEGSLTITKTVNGNDTDPDQEFRFTITLGDDSINGTYSNVAFTNGVATVTLKDAASVTILLPNGTTYTVVEDDYRAEGYLLTEKSGDEGTILETEPATAAFTNTRDTFGNLVVTKAVAGTGADTNKAFWFTVELSDTTINGTYGDMSFENGVATFALKDDGRIVAENLPNGITYKVTETDYSGDGYQTEATGNTGTILGGQEQLASFINTKKGTPAVPTGDQTFLTLWCLTFMACVTGLALVLVSGNRSRHAGRRAKKRA